MGAQCSVASASIVQGTLGAVSAAYGVRCLSGGCASLTGNTIQPGNVNASGTDGIGLEIDGAHPAVDANSIRGPGGSSGGIGGRFHALYLRGTTSLVTNNTIVDGAFGGLVEVVRYDVLALGPALRNVILHSNTIRYDACTACGPRVGLAIASTSGAASGPSGIVRNNIIEHNGVGGVTRPVIERDAMADFFSFENNDLFDPNVGGLVYVDEGTTPISITLVNALSGYAANIDVDCAPNASFHIAAASACRDTGTATGAPDHDFESDRRPQNGSFDIGADEFTP